MQCMRIDAMKVPGEPVLSYGKPPATGWSENKTCIH